MEGAWGGVRGRGGGGREGRGGKGAWGEVERGGEGRDHIIIKSKYQTMK